MHKVNRITVCRDNHNTQEEFENAVRDFIMKLLNEEYIVNVYYDEPGLGIVCIDFNYADQAYGCAYPYWLTPDEAEQIVFSEEV